MKVSLLKQERKAEIDKVEDEKLVWAIARLLHLDDEGGVPDWHKEIVEERLKKYEKGKGKLLDWDEAKKSL